MRFLIVAAFVCIVNILVFFQNYDFISFFALDPLLIAQWKDFYLPLFCFWFLIEGIMSLVKKRQSTIKFTSKEDTSLELSIKKLKERLEKAENIASNKQRAENVDAELLNLLSLFQQKGRFLDFLMEDIAKFSSEQISAASRVVHQGCSSVLKEYFSLQPIALQTQGASITLDENFNSREYKIIGQRKSEKPLTGKLLHKGWKTQFIKLPRIVRLDINSPSNMIITPAEVEIA